MTSLREWKPGRWWRVLHKGELWMETSDEEEARRAMRPGDTLQRLWFYEDERWEDAE